jgi:hypothetical protein
VISVRTLAEIGAPLPLDLRLGLSDGLPAPDRGMGPAFRVAPLDRGLVAPAQVGGVARVDLPLVPLLRAYGMHKPGLVTLVAEARPTGGNQPGGVRSNQITIQISEGREKQPIAKDAPAPTGSQPKESGDHRDEHQNPEARGDARPPSLGQPDLPEFATHAAAVKPLLRNGPLIEKEVEVFERERGGVAPLPPPLPVLPDHPDRTFLRRAEDALARPVWTPEDRRLLRRYFEALRRGG